MKVGIKMKLIAIRRCNFKLMPVHQSFIILSLLLVSVLIVNGQSNKSKKQVISAGSDETKRGRLLSKGNNKIPSGDLKVLTYKLEEINPTRKVRINNREIDLTGFRLTITVAKKLTGGSYLIWIDDNSYSAFTLGLYKLGIVLESEKLPDTTTLAVSPLLREGDDAKSKLSILPELLSVPYPYGYNTFESGNSNSYFLKRVSKFVPALNQNVPGVEIQIPNEDEYMVGSERWVIQIGNNEYYASVGDFVLTVWLSDEDFSQLNNGDTIKVKYGSGPLVNGATVGQLDKSLVQ